MKSRSGFTIIELMITIAVVAILATITTIAYSQVQTDSRNTARQGNATAIANALETYYTKNGEYPSVRSLVNNFPENTGTAVATKLGIDASTLRMPSMPSNQTNALTANTDPTNDNIAYIGSSEVNNSNCQNIATGGCDQFTLKYIEEGTGEEILIESKHKGRPDGFGSPPDAPPAPTLEIAQVGPGLEATATAQPCDPSSLTPKFSFRSRVSTGTWSPYTSWQTSDTYAYPSSVAQGSTYEFQAVTRCDNGSIPGASSPESAVASFTVLVGAPPAPTLNLALSGTNVVATITAVTCPSGTTAQYATRSRVNDGTWSSYSAWTTSLTASRAAEQGFKYGYQAKARCMAGSTPGPESTGAEKTYVRPISAPAAPAVSVSTSGSTSTYTWVATTCPTGTTARYQYRYLTDQPYTSSWYSASAPTSLNRTTSSQGYNYTTQLQAQCYTSYASSPWSGTGAANYIRPVSPPTNITWRGTKSGKRTVYMRVSATCGTGASLYSAFEEYSGKYPWTSGPNAGSTGWWGGWRLTHNYYGSTVTGGAVNTSDIASDATYRARANLRCKNSTTNRESSNTTYTSPLYTFGSLPND